MYYLKQVIFFKLHYFKGTAALFINIKFNCNTAIFRLNSSKLNQSIVKFILFEWKSCQNFFKQLENLSRPSPILPWFLHYLRFKNIHRFFAYWFSTYSTDFLICVSTTHSFTNKVVRYWKSTTGSKKLHDNRAEGIKCKENGIQ